MRKSKKPLSSGIPLELMVADTYNRLGKLLVKHNVTKTYQRRGKKAKCQFDVLYGIRTHVIECKYKGSNALVNVKAVGQLINNLVVARIPYNRATLVTNTDYEAKAQVCAHEAGITLINGKQLLKLYYRSRGLFTQTFGRKELDDIIKQYQ